MLKIKWQNGVNKYTTTYYEPFVRLDYCNAAWYKLERTDSEHNALQHKMHTIHYGFVSYDTPICMITYWHDLDSNRDGYNITVNRNVYNCSSSTIHQLSRFLRKTMGNLFTYHDIKDIDKRYPTYHDIMLSTRCIIHLYWSDSVSMRYQMEQKAHTIWHTNVG